MLYYRHNLGYGALLKGVSKLRSWPKCLGHETIKKPYPAPLLSVVNPSWCADRAMRANIDWESGGQGPNEIWPGL